MLLSNYKRNYPKYITCCNKYEGAQDSDNQKGQAVTITATARLGDTAALSGLTFYRIVMPIGTVFSKKIFSLKSSKTC